MKLLSARFERGEGIRLFFFENLGGQSRRENFGVGAKISTSAKYFRWWPGNVCGRRMRNGWL